MGKYVCIVCDYEFDGDFDSLPEDWTCPVCGVGKEQLEKVEE